MRALEIIVALSVSLLIIRGIKRLVDRIFTPAPPVIRVHKEWCRSLVGDWYHAPAGCNCGYVGRAD